MPDLADQEATKPARPRGVAGSIWLLEHAQDAVTIAVGVVLIALAVILVVAALVDFITSGHPMSDRASALLDQVLLVLILVEIVYTVVLSLRAHRLAAQPFIVVGLVAVIRRILVLLSSTSTSTVNTTELGLLIAMVVAFVAGLIAVSRYEKRDD
ncbi:MAG TPA: phosphate-starvation-inducible PsiE family protein [Streptosporangiaceae bacterium]